MCQDVLSHCFFFCVQKTLQREENDADGQLEFEEFVHYLQDYEKDLKLVVKTLDRKNAGVCVGGVYFWFSFFYPFSV